MRMRGGIPSSYELYNSISPMYAVTWEALTSARAARFDDYKGRPEGSARPRDTAEDKMETGFRKVAY